MLQFRRRAAALLALLLALLFAVPAYAVETPDDYDKNLPHLLSGAHLYAHSAALMDGMTGELLFRKNAAERMYPASTTKIMTLLIALESGISFQTPVIVPQQAAQIPRDSTLVPVFPGDQLTFGDLLYGFMLSSGNDGANAVAVLVGGSIENFVARMNARAAELGCTGTHFVNPHGYHDNDHYSTAEDLARITQEALKRDEFRRIVATASYTLPVVREGARVDVRVNNTNYLLREDSTYYYRDCIGVKTGTHSKAGNCFVGAAERDGVQLISVVLNSPQSNQKWTDSIRLLDYGFTCYTPYTLDQMFGFAQDQIARVKISNAAESDPNDGTLSLNIAQISDPDYIRMVTDADESALDEAVADFVSRSMLTITHSMVAPVSEGEIMGRFRYVAQSGEEITALLVAGRSIEAQPPKLSLTDFLPFLKQLENPLVRVLLAVVACLIVLLVIAGIIRRASRQRRRQEIYEVRRLEKLREDREREHRRIEARQRRRAERRASHRARYDDYFDDDAPDYDDFDDDDDFDDYDDYDDEDGDGYDEDGVRLTPARRRRRR